MNNFYLRKAKYEDKDILFSWANDDDCRKNSFNQELIEYNQHINWFKKKLNSSYSDIYILIKNNINLGQIRLDYINDKAYISYSIDKKYRGNNLGNVILSLVENIVKDNKSIKYLCGKVKYTNFTSIKKFEQLQYIRNDKENYIEFIKKIKD